MCLGVGWSWYLFAFSFHRYPRADAGKPLSSSSSREWEQFKCQGLLYMFWQEGGGSSGFQHMFHALEVYNNKLIFLV